MGCGVSNEQRNVAEEQQEPATAEVETQQNISVTERGFVSMDNEGNETVNPDAVPLTEKAVREQNEKHLDAKLTELEVIDRDDCVMQEVVTDNESINMEDLT